MQNEDDRHIYNQGENMFVYMIKNKVSGKSYVGATVRKQLYKRYGMHSWHNRLLSNPEIRKDYKKLGKDNFDIIVLFEPKTKKELYEKETFYINSLETLFPNGYNFQTGGRDGTKVHPETRKRISETMKKSYLPHRGVFLKNKTFPCAWCKKPVTSYAVRGIFKKTCSRDCFKSHMSKICKGKTNNPKGAKKWQEKSKTLT